MSLYNHMSYRSYQFLSFLGFKKFDAFTIAIHQAFVQIIYVIGVFGYLEYLGYKLDYNRFTIVILLVAILLGGNYFLIHHQGFDLLKTHQNKYSKTKRVLLDVFSVVYVAGAFVFITYTRNLKMN